MADIVDSAVRSRMMSAVKSKGTRPEVTVRKALHSAGFRYRLHRRDLAGTPDISLPKHKAVIFVNGCFWHGHECSLFQWPATRADFWARKINGNRKRDSESRLKLLESGWRRLVIWECALRGRNKLELGVLMKDVMEWINSSCGELEISGK